MGLSPLAQPFCLSSRELALPAVWGAASPATATFLGCALPACLDVGLAGRLGPAPLSVPRLAGCSRSPPQLPVPAHSASCVGWMLKPTVEPLMLVILVFDVSY